MTELAEFLNKKRPDLAEELAPEASAVQRHAWKAWNLMVEECEFDSNSMEWCWIGKTGAIAEKFGINPVYFSQAIGGLQRMECLNMLKRGGGKGGYSVLALLKAPTNTLWYSGRDFTTVDKAKAATNQRQHDLLVRLDRLETQVQAILEALSEKED